jgi:hypothetical protein
MMIHPSLILKVNLDERVATKATVEDLKRSYPYVAPISVGTHEQSDPVCNVMRMIVRLNKPYWTDDADGAQTWVSVRDWLAGKLYKVGSTVVNYNTSKDDDTTSVHYGRLEIDMKPYTFDLALPTCDELPAVDEQVVRFRELLVAGALPQDTVRVVIPSSESYAAQYAAAEAAAKEAAEKAAAEAAEKAAAEVAAAEAAAATAEQPDAETAAGEQAAEQVAAQTEGSAAELLVEGAPAGDETAEQPAPADAAQEEQPAPAAPQVVIDAVDYTVWGVVGADGVERAFDSAAGAWL